MFELGGSILGIIWFVVVLWAIVKTAQSSTSLLARLLWILILFFLPVIGFIAWLLLGPGRQRI